MAAPGRRRPATAGLAFLALAVIAMCSLAGCSRSRFPDRTARLTLGGTVTVFTIDSCGRDKDTLFVVGRTDGGQILQEVVGLRADRKTGIPELTGVSVTARDGSEQAAFGTRAWERRGRRDPAPGQIFSARLRGSRIQVSGAVESVSGDPGRVTTTTAGTTTVPSGDGGASWPVAFSLDARCDA